MTDGFRWLRESVVRLHWQARKKDSGYNLEAYLERTKCGYLQGGVKGKATQAFGAPFLLLCLRADLGAFRVELTRGQISRALLRHQLQGGTLRASGHEKWMQSRTVFQTGFHYVRSMNKVCQGKDRPLVLVRIFCNLSCNLEPGEIKTILKKAQSFTVFLLWILHLLRFCFVRNPDKTGIVGLHENGTEGSDLQSFWRKFTFTQKVTHFYWENTRALRVTAFMFWKDGTVFNMIIRVGGARRWKWCHF